MQGFMVGNTSSAFVKKYGPWALVRGASDGIGRAFAVQRARRGGHVILVARRRPQLEQLATSPTRSHGVQCQALAANLSHAEGVQQVLACSTDRDVGLVVCAAGFGTSGPFLQNDLSAEQDLLQVDGGALAAMSWDMGQRLVQRGRGGLLLLSSVVSFQGVARASLDALGRTGTLRTGFLAKLPGHSLALTPSRDRVKITGQVMAGMASRT